MRKVLNVMAPFIVLLIAWATATQAESFSDTLQSVLKVLPYVIAILALFMSVWYQNSNSFYLVSFILLTYILIVVAAPKPAMLNEIVTATSILLPLNCIMLGFSKERGVVSSYGMNKAIIVMGEIIWVFINMMGKASLTVPENTGPVMAISLKAPAIVLFVIAICLLLASYILRNQYMNFIFVAVLLASFISLHFANRTIIFTLFTTAIFLIIVIALFDVSYSLAFYDTLTGVLSRRALEQELLKLGNRYSIAMVDIDHFKQINDQFGHDIGDEVLRMVASILDRSSGKGKVFRYGGEEFAILFSNISSNEALPQLERIRKVIERRPFVLRSDNRPPNKPEKGKAVQSKGKGLVNVTVSIGVSQKTELLKTSYDVIRKADEALYKSKHSGRNCVTKL
ncbi:MAG: GGDEF domain-containing protein [Clostridia bacterium]|nr:GGDEF domain-containing protein [Clostridia bacterium]